MKLQLIEKTKKNQALIDFAIEGRRVQNRVLFSLVLKKLSNFRA